MVEVCLPSSSSRVIGPNLSLLVSKLPQIATKVGLGLSLGNSVRILPVSKSLKVGVVGIVNTMVRLCLLDRVRVPCGILCLMV